MESMWPKLHALCTRTGFLDWVHGGHSGGCAIARSKHFSLPITTQNQTTTVSPASPSVLAGTTIADENG